MPNTSIPAAIGLLCWVSAAAAQFDPQNAQWGKAEPTDIRIVTWNVEDAICTTETKTTASSDWHALVRTVAVLRPDVLLLQEAGDNSGNGTGSGVDSVANLATVIDLFMRGGADPFGGGQVTSYVQLYAPGFDMPYVHVSSDTDNFNRNVIVSRFPFADLNGDGASAYSDIQPMLADPNFDWNSSGDGGIRGQPVVEIDLPDGSFAGDLVVGNAHLKAGGNSSDFQQRDIAARNASYYMYYQYSGGGTTTPDPNGRIFGAAPTAVLDENTPVVWGGDWNQEGAGGGFRGPSAWFSEGLGPGGTDGTDADTSDSTLVPAADPFTGSLDTRSSSRLDYLAFQDSKAVLRNAFVFRSQSFGTAIPQELIGFSPSPLFVSNRASDHNPVGVDLIVELGGGGEPTPPGPFAILSPLNQAPAEPIAPVIEWGVSSGAEGYGVEIIGPNASTPFSGSTASTSVQLPELTPCETYAAFVTATNADGQTDASNTGAVFTIRGIADVTTTGATIEGQAGFGVPDGGTDADDLGFYLGVWVLADPAADLTTTGATIEGQSSFGVPDGLVDTDDLGYFLSFWISGCP